MVQAKRMIELGIEDNKDAAHPTIFKELVHSNLPPEEKSLERLTHEAQILIGAGGETVKHSASVGICHALLNPEILDQLKKELLVAWPDLDGPPPSLQELEQLPYLTAVIQEGQLTKIPLSWSIDTDKKISTPPRLRLGHASSSHLHQPLPI